MLVNKGDYLQRFDEQNKSHQYKVLMADDTAFLIGEIHRDEETGDIEADCEHLEMYANDESIYTLEDIRFTKLNQEIQ